MIGDRIKELRTKQSINQQKLSQLLGVSRSTVSMWEINKSEPDTQMLIKISNILDCSLDYLLEKSENKKQPADENISELDKKLINLLLDLSPDEVQRVRDFVEGLKANRTTASSQNQ